MGAASPCGKKKSLHLDLARHTNQYYFNPRPINYAHIGSMEKDAPAPEIGCFPLFGKKNIQATWT